MSDLHSIVLFDRVVRVVTGNAGSVRRKKAGEKGRAKRKLELFA